MYLLHIQYFHTSMSSKEHRAQKVCNLWNQAHAGVFGIITFNKSDISSSPVVITEADS